MRVNPIIGMNMSKGKWSRKAPQPQKPLDPDINNRLKYIDRWLSLFHGKYWQKVKEEQARSKR